MLGKHWKSLLVSLLGKNKSLLPEWWARWEMVENISGSFLRLVTTLLHENPSNESNYNSLTTNQSPMRCWLHFAMCPYTAVILSNDILLELLSVSISSMAPRDAPCQVKIRNMCFFFSTWLQGAMSFPKSSTDFETRFSNSLNCAVDFPLTPLSLGTDNSSAVSWGENSLLSL